MRSQQLLSLIRRVSVVALLLLGVLVGAAVEVSAHGDDVDVVVEAKASDPLDALHTDYALTLTFADGDVVEDAVVSASASDGTETVLPLEVTTAGNVYAVHFIYPQPGQWTLTLAVDHPDVEVELSLVETIPVGDPGTQLVRLDTADESRVGGEGTLTIPDHPLAVPSTTSTTTMPPGAGSSTTAAAAASTPSTSEATTTIPPASSTTVAAATGSHGAMVQVTATGVLSLPVELLLRWAHLGMITLWGLAVLALLVHIGHRLVPAASLAGLAGTLVTGLLLSLWGTPVGYPGIFRWSDLGALDYGAAWQSSFLLKMVGVVIAVVGTIAATRRRGWGAFLGAAGMGIALIVVTALSQFHLLTHG